MQRHDFAYDLPPDLIAQTPLAERSASRLLVLDGAAASSRDPAAHASAQHRPAPLHGPAQNGPSQHGPAQRGPVQHDPAPRGRMLHDRTIRDLPDLLLPGDLLVFNDTKVVAARLVGAKPSGGRVEIFLERIVAPREALAQLRASKPIREGLEVTTAGGVVRILGRQDDLWRVGFSEPALEFFEQWGEVPLPPYIHRAPDANDRERYQSIFARERGAVAAPTASLHFDSQITAAIEARGVSRAFITLHVGAGTFQPLRTDDLESHTMHAERVSVSAATCAAIEKTRAAGGRVVAVGTTVVRALESAALELAAGRSAGTPAETLLSRPPAIQSSDVSPAGEGALQRVTHLPPAGWSGETRLFIRPGFHFQVTDALLTNFHLPESTLLMLVCAFGGKDPVLAAYRHAVQSRYRFFSYGDAMFLTRAKIGSRVGS